ncbi:N-acetyltransferase [Thermococci archaeon]|nr:MAG: N-acetyltransferase [Thermococci archaeon]RLF93652.1 MAG: N-acetyltransferase [Thermococci archaeon]
MVRRVRRKDSKVFVEVYLRAYKGLEEYSYTRKRDVKRYFSWLLSRDPEGFFLYELEGEALGFIASDSRWFSHFEEREIGEIHELFVDPLRRRMGIGSSLLRVSLRYLASKGRKEVGLWVGSENRIAKEFYSKMGFSEVGKWGIWTRMRKSL